MADGDPLKLLEIDGVIDSDLLALKDFVLELLRDIELVGQTDIVGEFVILSDIDRVDDRVRDPDKVFEMELVVDIVEDFVMLGVGEPDSLLVGVSLNLGLREGELEIPGVVDPVEVLE
jgi:hypothetical protein